MPSEKTSINHHDIFHYMRCPTFATLYASESEKDPERPYLIHEALKQVHYDEVRHDAVLNEQSCTALLKSSERICFNRPQIQQSNLYSQPDIVIIHDKKVEILQVNLGFQPTQTEKIALAFSAYCLQKLGFSISKLTLLCVSDSHKADRPIFFKRMMMTYSLMKQFSKIKHIVHTLQSKQDISPSLGKRCFKPKSCSFFSNCWTQEKDWDIFRLFGMPIKKKLSYFETGVKSYDDIQNTVTDLSQTQTHQIAVDKTQMPYINQSKLDEFYASLQFPLSCFDIEAVQFILPPFPDLKPFSYLPFLFSFHHLDEHFNVIEDDSDLFYPDTDTRLDFVKTLIQRLRHAKSIVVFDATLERAILHQLMGLYPGYRNELERICKAFVYIAPLFTDRHIILPGMNGKCSLKSILPCIDKSLSFDNLTVSSGFDASFEYKKLRYDSAVDKEKLSTQLKRYCHMDTLALAKIVKFFS